MFKFSMMRKNNPNYRHYDNKMIEKVRNSNLFMLVSSSGPANKDFKDLLEDKENNPKYGFEKEVM